MHHNLNFKSLLLITSMVNKNNNLGLPSPHAYSIIGYDPKTDQVQIRNPWGLYGELMDKNHNPLDGVNDSIFFLSLDKFIEQFHQVNYEL